jgi:hypothetical protein
VSSSPEVSVVLPPNAFRAQTILHGASGLPQDRYVNTWWFARGGSTADRAAAANTISQRLGNFFNATDIGLPLPLCAYLSETAIDQARGLEVRVYDTNESEPREPSTVVVPLVGFEATVALPSEVAVCLSYYSVRNIPRHRGRIYFGPLNLNAMSTADGMGDPNVSQSLIDTLQSRASILSGYTDLPWVVCSLRDQALREITAGWVDNAFDTQRRRGATATRRESWVASNF